MPQEKEYKLSLKDRKEIAYQTEAFLLAGRPFNFKAGQHIIVSLESLIYPDDKGKQRIFSIASSPQEKDILIATRLTESGFKKTLMEIPLGSLVAVEGPFGHFTLHQDSQRTAVFLVGGIGITPIRSIVKDATEKRLPHKMVLFYANRRVEEAAFLKDFQTLEKENPNFKLIPTMTEMEKSDQAWQGLKGYINESMIKTYVPDLNKAIFYIVGPPKMVAAMRQLLETQLKISEDYLRIEEFSGY